MKEVEIIEIDYKILHENKRHKKKLKFNIKIKQTLLKKLTKCSEFRGSLQWIRSSENTQVLHHNIIFLKFDGILARA